MLAKIKIYAILVLSAIAAFFYVRFSQEKLKAEKQRRKRAEKALKVVNKANDRVKQVKQKAKDDVKKALQKADTGDRSHFE